MEFARSYLALVVERESMEKRRNEWKIVKSNVWLTGALTPVRVVLPRSEFTAFYLMDVRKHEVMSKRVKPLTNEPGHAP